MKASRELLQLKAIGKVYLGRAECCAHRLDAGSLPVRRHWPLVAPIKNSFAAVAVRRCRPHNGCIDRSLQSAGHLMPPTGVWEGPHAILHFVSDDDVCACFRAGELNIPLSSQGRGISCGRSNNTSHNAMTDPLTDSILTEDGERSAPGMSHADTHTPLHGPTGGVRRAFRQGTLRPAI
eukprot:scaffold7412_cov123-Isochrysis_galbana.AAC.6